MVLRGTGHEGDLLLCTLWGCRIGLGRSALVGLKDCVCTGPGCGPQTERGWQFLLMDDDPAIKEVKWAGSVETSLLTELTGHTREMASPQWGFRWRRALRQTCARSTGLWAALLATCTGLPFFFSCGLVGGQLLILCVHLLCRSLATASGQDWSLWGVLYPLSRNEEEIPRSLRSWGVGQQSRSPSCWALGVAMVSGPPRSRWCIPS